MSNEKKDPVINTFQRLKFKAFTKDDFKTPVSGGEYTVKINPSEFTRNLSVKTTTDKNIRSDNSSGQDAGLGAETYSFELVFDNTGVLGWVYDGGLKEELKRFLSTVYAREDSETKKKTANFVEITYCGEQFKCKLTSMVLKYTLFNQKGDPLRAKATCSFTSVDNPKKDGKNGKKGKKVSKPKPQPLPPEMPSKNCCCCCDNFNDTMSVASQNGSVSIWAVNSTPAR